MPVVNIHYDQILSDHEAITKKLLTANGYDFDVDTVHREDISSDDIHGNNAIIIVPLNDTLNESFATSEELRDLEIATVGYLEKEGISTEIEKLKSNLVSLLYNEYKALPTGDLIDHEITSVEPSKLLREFQNASFIITSKFLYLLKKGGV